MKYEVLEIQIKSLPAEAVTEVMHYVNYLTSLYSNGDRSRSITDRINKFMAENPTEFDEFLPVEGNPLLSAIRGLTKDDTW